MPKEKRKHLICPNCGHIFAENTANNFCPDCGQENVDSNVSFGELLGDFVSNYLSLDSKLFRTLPRLLFFPGFLTNAFNKGKRITYLRPIRLYLFMSVVYFTFFAAQFKNLDGGEIQITQQEKMDSILHLKDSISNEILQKELLEKNIVIEEDTTNEYNRKILKVPNKDYNIQFSFPEEDGSLIREEQIRRIVLLSKKYGIEATIDSLKKENSIFTRNTLFTKGTRQLLRIYHQGPEKLASYFFARLPIMMLLTIPIFAFIFKILYIRRKRHYIEHIVFLLHFHAFLYVVLTLLLWTSDFLSEMYIVLLLGMIFIYFLVAIRKVYQQGWAKSFLKGMMFCIFYPICLTIAVSVTAITAFLMF
ncbi:MAG: DUF3667 domain-containing protein [Chitinophagales bacterium]